MKVVFSLLFVLLLCACNRKTKIPGDVLQPSKMQLVLWDISKADALVDEIVKKDSTKKLQEESALLQSEVFNIHKISREKFYKSYNFYAQHTELMQALLDSIVTYASRATYNIHEKNKSSVFPVKDTLIKFVQ